MPCQCQTGLVVGAGSLPGLVPQGPFSTTLSASTVVAERLPHSWSLLAAVSDEWIRNAPGPVGQAYRFMCPSVVLSSIFATIRTELLPAFLSAKCSYCHLRAASLHAQVGLPGTGAAAAQSCLGAGATT